MNIFTFLIYGFSCENYYGTSKLFIIFWIVGASGNLFASLFKTDKVYAGASASIYGIYGMYTVYLIMHYNYMGEERKKHIKNFIWVIFAALILYMLDLESDSVSLPFSYVLGVIFSLLFI